MAARKTKKATTKRKSKAKPLVGIVMGSNSDRETMEEAVKVLDQHGVASELVVRSAHRTPAEAGEWARTAPKRGIKVIIAAAGGAAHLAGAMAAHSRLPILGVPLGNSPLSGFDALLSTVQMPPGVPVGTLGVGAWGARNAAHLAVRILGLSDAKIARKVDQVWAAQAKRVLAADKQR